MKIGQHEIGWGPLIFIVAVHLVALTAAPFTFSWPALAVCLILYWLTGGLGISLGFHRLLTHRSFRTSRPLRYFFAFLGSLACQGGPLTWVSTHRLHHRDADGEGDPHSPAKGFFWAHMGWCFVKKPPSEYAFQAKVAPDVARDPGMVFLERTFVLWNVVLGLFLYLWGGWPFVIWGIFVRLVLSYHCTWFVNSAAHTWGYRRYKTGDRSRNLWWVALISYGEGWHNNHHAYASSARHGHKWWEIDITYITIRLLGRLGLAHSIRSPRLPGPQTGT